MTTLMQTTGRPADEPAGPPPQGPPTVWGLDPAQLHARYWASRGVQVVRPGERTELVHQAELFLLTGNNTLTLFRPAAILDDVAWMNPDLVYLRLERPKAAEYRESIQTGKDGAFRRFERVYKAADSGVLLVGLTPHEEIARIWQSAATERDGWRKLRASVNRSAKQLASARARVFDASRPEESARFVRDLVQQWSRPDATVDRIRSSAPGVWCDQSANVKPGKGVRGPLWIGAGRTVDDSTTAVGPAVMWDDPQARPEPEAIEWLELEALDGPSFARREVKRTQIRHPLLKRTFDILFSLVALLVTLPLYPFIALAIIIEDGFPLFFAHHRETINGREFGCLKFRSMRKDAEKMKAELAAANQADGPQFFIENDPRLTRVGRFIRKYQLDELPQFINVLKGDMSVVGPRPSPYKENQFCPPWREARLSVRPGVTGLWQIRRTRAGGNDFQEWIKYDIQYVEQQSLWLDIKIIWQTVLLVFRKATES